MSKSSTKQIDALWIVHSAKSDRCYLKDILSKFDAFIGPGIRELTTVIVNKCDSLMKIGDYLQYPNKDPFIFPESYDDLN
jgi:hypothetical protein